jgi:hypothetical protein
VFHTDVAKADRDVAYVTMVVYICCKLLFLKFHPFFRRMLQVCLFGCCICFHIYDTSVYLDVVYVYNGFKCFSGVFEIVS